MSSFNELSMRSSTLLVSEPPFSLRSLPFGADEWLPWPMTTPKVVAYTYELDIARAQLGVIIRDMLEFQAKHRSAARHTEYLDSAEVIHARYRNWESSLSHQLQSCELASQQQILLQ